MGHEVRDGSRGHITELMKTKVRGLSFILSGRKSHRRVLSSGVAESVYIQNTTLTAVWRMNCGIARVELGKLTAKLFVVDYVRDGVDQAKSGGDGDKVMALGCM